MLSSLADEKWLNLQKENEDNYSSVLDQFYSFRKNLEK